MSIGISPFTPTPLDRKDDARTRNPRQPDAPADDDAEPLSPGALDSPAGDGEAAPDALERAVPPLPQTR